MTDLAEVTREDIERNGVVLSYLGKGRVDLYIQGNGGSGVVEESPRGLEFARYRQRAIESCQFRARALLNMIAGGSHEGLYGNAYACLSGDKKGGVKVELIDADLEGLRTAIYKAGLEIHDLPQEKLKTEFARETTRTKERVPEESLVKNPNLGTVDPDSKGAVDRLKSESKGSGVVKG